MTKFFNLLVGLFLLATLACNNETKKETTVKEKSANTSNAERAKETEVSVGPDGVEVKTENGTQVKVGEEGVNVDSKDAKVDIKSKDEKQ